MCTRDTFVSRLSLVRSHRPGFRAWTPHVLFEDDEGDDAVRIRR